MIQFLIRVRINPQRHLQRVGNLEFNEKKWLLKFLVIDRHQMYVFYDLVVGFKNDRSCELHFILMSSFSVVVLLVTRVVKILMQK